MRALLLLGLVATASARGPWEDARAWASRTAAEARRLGTPYVRSLNRDGSAAWGRALKATDRRATKLKRDYASMRLDERRALLTELWRMRAALDLTAGLDPKTLEALTGLRPKDVDGWRTRLNSILGKRGTP